MPLSIEEAGRILSRYEGNLNTAALRVALSGAGEYAHDILRAFGRMHDGRAYQPKTLLLTLIQAGANVENVRQALNVILVRGHLIVLNDDMAHVRQALIDAGPDAPEFGRAIEEMFHTCRESLTPENLRIVRESGANAYETARQIAFEAYKATYAARMAEQDRAISAYYARRAPAAVDVAAGSASASARAESSDSATVMLAPSALPPVPASISSLTMEESLARMDFAPPLLSLFNHLVDDPVAYEALRAEFGRRDCSAASVESSDSATARVSPSVPPLPPIANGASAADRSARARDGFFPGTIVIRRSQINACIRAKIPPVAASLCRPGESYTPKEKELACNLLTLLRGPALDMESILTVFREVFSEERAQVLAKEVIENPWDQADGAASCRTQGA